MITFEDRRRRASWLRVLIFAVILSLITFTDLPRPVRFGIVIVTYWLMDMLCVAQCSRVDEDEEIHILQEERQRHRDAIIESHGGVRSDGSDPYDDAPPTP